MGWLFSPRWATRADIVTHLRKPSRFGDKFELVKATVSGNRHWYLIRERDTGMHWIGLDLIKSGRGEGWGYKDMDETVAPCAYDCPVSYLDAPHAPREGYAAEWRAKVREYHANIKSRPKYAPGLRVTLGTGWIYTLIRPERPRMGWVVTRNDNTEWRMPFSTLSRSQIVN